MTREAKVGLMMVAVLVGVFGFLIYKKVHRPAEGRAAQVARDDTNPAADAGGTSDFADNQDFGRPRELPRITDAVELAAEKIETFAEDVVDEIDSFAQPRERRASRAKQDDFASNDDDFSQIEPPKNTREWSQKIPAPEPKEDAFDDLPDQAPPSRNVAKKVSRPSSDPFDDDSTPSKSRPIDYTRTVRQVSSDPFTDDTEDANKSNDFQAKQATLEAEDPVDEPRRTQEFDGGSELMPREKRRAAPIAMSEDFNSSTPRYQNTGSVDGPTYTIQPNDSFWSISRKRYGAGRYYMALAQHNRQAVPDPNRMKPGVVISTPDPAELEQQYANSIPKAASAEPSPVVTTAHSRKSTESEPPGYFMSAEGHPMYRVGSRDTLTEIAKSHLGRTTRWVQILEMNRNVLRDGNELKIGTVLRLPADATRVRVVGTTRDFR